MNSMLEARKIMKDRNRDSNTLVVKGFVGRVRLRLRLRVKLW